MNAKRPNSKYYLLQGIIICLCGSVLFSTKAIFVKLAYHETDIDSLTLLALRMIFSLPFFVGAALVSSNRTSNVKFTAKQWVNIAIIGCLGYYISSLLDFIGLQYVSAGIERLILFIFPTLVLLMSSVFFKERIKPFQWVALAVTYVGLAIAYFGEINYRPQQKQDFLFGSLMIFICAITYAVYIVGSGRLIPTIGATKFNSYAMSFASVAVLVHFFSGNGSLLGLTTQVYVYGFLMAIFSTVIPSYLVTAAINRIGSDNSAIVSSAGPVSTMVLAYIFLSEDITTWQVSGTVFILVGVWIIGKQKSNANK